MMYGDFVWFMGVVEDRLDPEEMNRVRVRCFGFHTESTSLLATEDLPWATVMLPTTSSGMSGLQSSPHGLVEGSWVMGFFRDGNDCQDPVILGSISSQALVAANTSAGFADPSGTYPKKEYLNTPDVNEHARSVETTLVTAKKDSITEMVATAAGSMWDEPETPYASEYPKNHVYESESGHLLEIDDTTGAERLHEYHRSGTFRETHPDGSVVNRIVTDKYEIIAGDEYVNVKGNVNLTIDGNCETYVKGNHDIKVDGNVTRTITGTLTETVTGNVTQNYAASKTTTIGATDTVTAPNVSFTFDAGSIVVSSGNITDTNVTLHSHKHTQGPDADANSQAPTDPPISGT